MNLLTEEGSENCVLQNSDNSSKIKSKSSYSYPISRKTTSRSTHSYSSINISDSSTVLESEKMSAESLNNLRDFWPGVRNQASIVKQLSIFADQRLFLICESCFWCASCFRSSYLIHDCPMCYNGKLDCMPIGDDEKYGLPKGVEERFSNDFLMIF